MHRINEPFANGQYGPWALLEHLRRGQCATSDGEEKSLRERLFGRPPAASAETLRKSYGGEAPREISAIVRAVESGGGRLLQITLENGQVWGQEDYGSFSLRAGDSIEIKAGALGSYYLRREGQGRSIRVKRVR